MVGFLDLINDPEIALSGDESAELMTIARREASRMSRIVADLVLLARSAPGEMTILAKTDSRVGIDRRNSSCPWDARYGDIGEFQ